MSKLSDKEWAGLKFSLKRNNKTKGKDLFVLFGDAFVDSKLGAQVSLKTAL